MRAWTIRPLHVGTLHRKRCEFLWRDRDVAPFDAPVIMYLLESAGERVLVDSGCSDPAHAHPEHHPFSRPPEQHPVAVLAALGVAPGDVTLVINTHLHWDHCSGNAHFAGARMLVQREELRYAVAPLPWNVRSYSPPAPGEMPPWARGSFEPLDGEAGPRDGLRIIPTPGHTPGSQSVVVDTHEGRYVLAGDNVPLYDNWNGRGAAWPFIPNENHYDLSAYARSMQTLRELGAPVIPSHDMRVFAREVYG